MNSKMINSDKSNDRFFQKDLIDAKRKLLEERWFLESKMRGNDYMPSDYSTFAEKKYEIFSHIKKDLETRLDGGSTWDQAFKDRVMTRWLDLYERASKTEFKISTYSDEEVNTVLTREVPVPYGPPRDLEMLHDYLSNYMSYEDALNLCECIIRYYHFGSLFAFS